MKAIIFLTYLLFSQSVFGGTPTEVLGEFKKAAKAKDFDGAWKHAVKFKQLPAPVNDYLKGKVKKVIALTAAGWDFKALEEKIDGDCAVVIINEFQKGNRTSSDIDPAYLLKQGGEWKILPDISEWKSVRQVQQDKVKNFKRLEAWYEKREKELRKELLKK